MSGKRYSESQILGVLSEIDGGASIAHVSRVHGIGVQTIYGWRKKYAGMSSSELAELKALQEENKRSKRIVAKQAMDTEMLKELSRGKW